MALAKLHNFCIDEQQTIEEMTTRDVQHIQREGAVPLEVDERTDVLLPRQLIGGCNHFEEINQNKRQRQMQRFHGIFIPRDQLHAEVMDKDLHWPQPKGQCVNG